MFLNLEEDAAKLYNYIVSRASKYSPTSDHGPGGTGPIQMVYAGYEFDQAGWFALVFDRRPDAGHDGEWTGYLNDRTLFECPHWVKAAALSVSEKEFSQSLGEMLVEVLLRAKNTGALSKLPLASDYRLGLEEFNGSFGWDSQTD